MVHLHHDDEDINEGPSSPQRWRHNLKSHWYILLLGQAVSVLGAVTGATQSELSLQCHWSSPAFSVFLFYAAMIFFLIPLHRSQKAHVRLNTEDNDDDNNNEGGAASSTSTSEPQNRLTMEVDETSTTIIDTESIQPTRFLFLQTIWLQAPPWFYMIIGSLDVSASFCFVSALNDTNMTAVSLLSSLSIPTTMILSFVCLKRRYQLWHYVGVSLCLFGIAIRVGQDWEQDHHPTTTTSSDDDIYPHKFRGDLLACMGGIFYGINNVLGEVAVQQLGGPYEFLGMMGFFAAILAFVYAMFFERTDIQAFLQSDACSSQTSTLLLLAFVSTNVLGYYGGAIFLQISDATYFDLSFQTGTLWSVIFSIFGQHIFPDPLFYVALIITVSGVVVYEMAPSPHRETNYSVEPMSPEPESSIHLRELS